jgi:hypothetical protein
MFASQLCFIPAYAYSDNRMRPWWEDNFLEDTIDKYKKKGPLQNGRNFDPSSFLQHLNAGKDYLHYGVNIYVRRLYKDYNGVGHHALFQKADSKFNRALDAAKKAADEKDKKRKRRKLEKFMEEEKKRKRLEAEAKDQKAAEEKAAAEEQKKRLAAKLLEAEEKKRKEEEAAQKAIKKKAAAEEQKNRLAAELLEAEEKKRKEEEAAQKALKEKADADEQKKRLAAELLEAEEKKRKEEEAAQNAAKEKAEENRQRREPPSQLQVTINEPLRDKIYQQLSMVAGTDKSQLESYVPKEILELTDEEEEKQWNDKKDAAAKFAIKSVIDQLDHDLGHNFDVDSDEVAEITKFYTCLMENYVFDMGFRVDYGNNSIKCLCPCW